MNFKEAKRTHDKFYLEEDRRGNPKQYFKFVLENTSLDLNDRKVIDIGCATGDFLYFLNEKFPNAILHGADIDEDLLLKAKERVPDIKKLFRLDISNLKKEIGSFDVVYMLGVHSIFDDLNWLNSVKKILKDKDSRAYIFGIFNPDNIDVILRARKSKSIGDWETGWNVFSKSTIEGFMENNNLRHKFVDFDLDIDIDKNKNDPMRSWTIKTDSKSRIVINGLCLMHYFSLLEVSFFED